MKTDFAVSAGGCRAGRFAPPAVPGGGVDVVVFPIPGPAAAGDHGAARLSANT